MKIECILDFLMYRIYVIVGRFLNKADIVSVKNGQGGTYFYGKESHRSRQTAVARRKSYSCSPGRQRVGSPRNQYSELHQGIQRQNKRSAGPYNPRYRYDLSGSFLHVHS